MKQNYPSIKTLMSVNQDKTSLEAAKLARTILAASKRSELESLPVYDQYYQRIGIHMYNPHSFNELKMQLLDLALEGYGVEAFRTEKRGYCDYINFGDTYITTIVYFQGRFSVCSWGDIAEKYECY